MNKRKPFLLLGVICLALVLAVSPFLSACAKPAAGPITLKAVGFLPKGATSVKFLGTYIDMVNERAEGELVIEWVGGPDVIPGFDQGAAVSSGTIDMAGTCHSYYTSLAPAGFATCILSQFTPMKERENGVFDFIAAENEKINIHFLGRLETNRSFHIGLKEAVERPQDLAGRKIRTMALYDYFLNALGAVPVTVAHPEVYSALERGVVEGYAYPFSDAVELSLYEVCGYFIDHTFYEAGNVIAIMNLDKWNSLPKKLQNLMTDAMKDMEPQMYDMYGEAKVANKQVMIDNGMVPIKFSDADAKYYRDLAYSSFRKGIKELVTPEAYAKIIELTGE